MTFSISELDHFPPTCLIRQLGGRLPSWRISSLPTAGFRPQTNFVDPLPVPPPGGHYPVLTTGSVQQWSLRTPILGKCAAPVHAPSTPTTPPTGVLLRAVNGLCPSTSLPQPGVNNTGFHRSLSEVTRAEDCLPANKSSHLITLACLTWASQRPERIHQSAGAPPPTASS